MPNSSKRRSSCSRACSLCSGCKCHSAGDCAVLLVAMVSAWHQLSTRELGFLCMCNPKLSCSSRKPATPQGGGCGKQFWPPVLRTADAQHWPRKGAEGAISKHVFRACTQRHWRCHHAEEGQAVKLFACLNDCSAQE